MAALCKIAEHCEYGPILNDMLQDRLVCGVTDQQVQHCYLQETSLTYTEARYMVLASETADKDSKRLQEARIDASSAPQGEI